jgi:hypothetical protein
MKESFLKNNVETLFFNRTTPNPNRSEEEKA